MTAKPTDREASKGRRGGGTSAEPNPGQQEILLAYAEHPNAAAVARALRSNERHVRRIVDKFPTQLDEIRRERHRERREKAEAREAKMHKWADDSIEQCLGQLDALTQSENETVALRSLKLKLDLVLRMPPVMSNIDLLEDFDRGLTVLLCDAENAEDQANQGERDHG